MMNDQLKYRIVSSLEMKKMESETINGYGIPSLSLMERAAYQSYEKIKEISGDIKNAVIFCGSGNNGGDGFSIGRIMNDRNIRVKIIFVGNPDKMTSEAGLNKAICEKRGIEITDIDYIKACTDITENADVIVDAMLGIGITGEVRPRIKSAANLIKHIRDNNRGNKKVFAIDIPSGLNSDTGMVMGSCVPADHTITMQWIKRGLILNKGPEYTGEIIPIDVNIYDDGSDINTFTCSLDLYDYMPKKSITGNKGTSGKILFITGSAGMPGAMILSAKAALLSGGGMVKVISDSVNRDLLVHELPEAMFQDINDDKENILKSFEWCTSLVIGCGLGDSPAVKNMVLYALKNCSKPVVVDADGLNILSGYERYKIKEIFNKRYIDGAPTIITPHPGEFARLFKTDLKDKNNQDPDFVRELAEEFKIIIIAKDARTIVSDGKTVYINTVTSKYLGTAGSGDVLAGMTGYFAGIEKDMFDAAVYSVFLHGYMGEKAGERRLFEGIRAGDITDALKD